MEENSIARGTKYLSQVADASILKPRVLNIIETPCGSGKTHFAVETLAQSASRRHKLLYLTDTINTRSEVLKHPNTQHYSNEWFRGLRQPPEFGEDIFDREKVVAMTYAKFGSLVCEWNGRHKSSLAAHFEYIVCDEFHNLMKYIHFKDRKNPEAENKCAKMALGALESAIELPHTTLVALSATPALIFKELASKHYPFWRVPIDSSQLFHYVENERHTYTNIDLLLGQQTKGTKGIVYTGHIREMKRLETVARQNGLSTVSFWSTANQDHTMTAEQLSARDYLLFQEEVPPQYDVLFINASCETGVTIRGELDYIIIHSRNPDTQTQVRGRYRADLNRLYVRANRGEEEVWVPDEYMGRKLFVEDKKQLCDVLCLPDAKGACYQWNTVSLRLIEAGYRITDGRENNRRFSLITE